MRDESEIRRVLAEIVASMEIVQQCSCGACTAIQNVLVPAQVALMFALGMLPYAPLAEVIKVAVTRTLAAKDAEAKCATAALARLGGSN